MSGADIRRLARDFAMRIQALLNGTICEGVKIVAVASPRNDHLVVVGHGLTRNHHESEPFPLALRRNKPKAWLDVAFTLRLDESARYLTVQSSYFGVYATNDSDSCLCHFDYERGKNDYPEAHVQVFGDSLALARWSDRIEKRRLNHLHLPVGGRRNRPTLEDVVEFLIIERITDARAGWKMAIEAGREEFRRLQLRAAIRRDPETARTALVEFDST